jgi:hypothetical protein
MRPFADMLTVSLQLCTRSLVQWQWTACTHIVQSYSMMLNTCGRRRVLSAAAQAACRPCAMVFQQCLLIPQIVNCMHAGAQLYNRWHCIITLTTSPARIHTYSTHQCSTLQDVQEGTCLRDRCHTPPSLSDDNSLKKLM